MDAAQRPTCEQCGAAGDVAHECDAPDGKWLNLCNPCRAAHINGCLYCADVCDDYSFCFSCGQACNIQTQHECPECEGLYCAACAPHPVHDNAADALAGRVADYQARGK